MAITFWTDLLYVCMCVCVCVYLYLCKEKLSEEFGAEEYLLLLANYCLIFSQCTEKSHPSFYLSRF